MDVQSILWNLKVLEETQNLSEQDTLVGDAFNEKLSSQTSRDHFQPVHQRRGAKTSKWQ